MTCVMNYTNATVLVPDFAMMPCQGIAHLVSLLFVMLISQILTLIYAKRYYRRQMLHGVQTHPA